MIAEKKNQLNFVEIIVFQTSFVAATYAFGVYLFATLVPDIRTEMGFGHSLVGVATGTAQFGNMILALIAGLLIPRIGAIRTIYLFLTISALCQAAFYFIASPLTLIALLFCLGGCGSAVWVAIVAASQHVIPKRHRGKALSTISSGSSFGLLLNGLFVPILLEANGWRIIWLVVSVITLFLTAVSWLRLRVVFNQPGFIAPKTGTSLSPKEYAQLFSNANAIVVILLLFGTAFALVPYQTYLTSFLRESANWLPDTSARIWIVIGLGGMFGGITLGTLADHTSEKRILVFTFIVLACVIPLPIYFGQNWLLVQFAVFLFGMGYFAIFGLIAANISKTFPPELVAILTGGSFLAVGIGSSIGNFIGGQVVEASSSFFLLFISSSGVVLVLALLSLLLRSTPNQVISNINRSKN